MELSSARETARYYVVAVVISLVEKWASDPMNVKQMAAEKKGVWSANLPRRDKLNHMNDIAVQDLFTPVGLMWLRGGIFFFITLKRPPTPNLCPCLFVLNNFFYGYPRKNAICLEHHENVPPLHCFSRVNY